jgi:predicted Zn-dependent peptidase
VLNARVVDEHLIRALRLLVEMLTDSQFDPEEFERERGVILEEYKMYEDTPDELVMDRFMEGLYHGHALGRPILGTPDHLNRFQPADLRKYLARVVRPDRLVVAATGRLDADQLMDEVERLLGGLPAVDSIPGPVSPAPNPAYQHRVTERDLEQTHFVIGTTGPNRHDDRRFPFAVMSAVLGAGPGSRIFQEVREKRGLAYSIGTFEWYFQDTGCLAISGGTSAETYEEVEEICLKEISRLGKELPTDEEVECAKAQIRTGVVLGAESSGGRMARLGEQELWYGKLIPMDETLAKLDAVTTQDVMESAREWLIGKPFTASIIGEEVREPTAQSL